jgi:hypothetical protein
MNRVNPKVDGYLRKNKKWQEELQKLRGVILDRQLTEEVKWRVPCYTRHGRNIVFLGAFKEFCALSFVKGALLKDARKILIQQTENSQSVRVIRFTDVREIVEMEPILKSYIDEAIEVEKAGLKVKLKKITERKIHRCAPSVPAHDKDKESEDNYTLITSGTKNGGGSAALLPCDSAATAARAPASAAIRNCVLATTTRPRSTAKEQIPSSATVDITT